MAYYKVGHKILNEEEYDQHAGEIWAFGLFIIGALLTGMVIIHQLPEEWSKELRYAIVLGASLGAGITLGAFARFIRMAFFIGIFIALIGFVLSWLWSII